MTRRPDAPRRRHLGGLVALLLVGNLAPALARGQDADDVAGVAGEDHALDKDGKLVYVLIEAKPAAPEPPAGYKLLVVLPGGDGSRDFLPFVKRIYKYALSPEYLVVELVAPQWSDSQPIVWPTEKDRQPGMKTSTEKFLAEAVEDVVKRRKIDRRQVFALAWSSGGPAAYAASLAKDRVLTATMPAMSVFFPSKLPPLDQAKGHAYYLLHSPDDQVCKFAIAKRASETLAKAGATVKLVEYPGGHGWQGDVFGNIHAGVVWMEEQTQTR